jgi:hypothetical protein
MSNITVTVTLTPEQQTALYDALFSRAVDLETNVPGSDRSSTMNEVAACLIDQIGFPVPLWMSSDVSMPDADWWTETKAIGQILENHYG